jgi:sugar phosphate isomerase/epimerase
LLRLLAEGKVTPDMREAIQKADKLRAGLPQIHGEHRELMAGMKRLAEAAKALAATLRNEWHWNAIVPTDRQTVLLVDGLERQ